MHLSMFDVQAVAQERERIAAEYGRKRYLTAAARYGELEETPVGNVGFFARFGRRFTFRRSTIAVQEATPARA
jgi:hypothetical protein